MNCILELNKSTSTNQAVVSDIITYTLEVKNISNEIAHDVVVKDLLPEELKFILGSVKVDYIPDTYSNIISGVKLGSIDPNGIRVISFDAEILKKSGDTINNRSFVEFKYIQDSFEYCNCSYSNIVSIFVKNPKLQVSKTSDKEIAQLDEIINFTIIISNTGDLDAQNLFLIDTTSESVKLIDGSFTTDGTVVNSVELNKGVSLNNLKVGNQQIIKYSVKVESGGCNGKIYNKSRVEYSYTLQNGITNYKESNTSEVCVNMSISSFKQFSIDGYLTIPHLKPDISEINDVKAYVKIDKCNIIKTPIAKSSEGQNLSGYKLIVHGKVIQTIEYIACEPTQSVHSAHYNIPFSTYIVLPRDFKPGNNIDVEGIVEDVYYDVISNRCFFKNVTLLLVARITCFK